MEIILASGSPRRRELLTKAQVDFKVLSVDIDETQQLNEMPKDYIERMVKAKAAAAVEQLNKTHTLNKPAEPMIILTADTIGVLADGQTVLVKPTDRDHAYRMWQQMSDNTHEVWTAVQATKIQPVSKPSQDGTIHDSRVLNNDSTVLNCIVFEVVEQQQLTERTDVTFIPLTVQMMSDYWNSGEPVDKAGGYGIQGLGAAWVERINGSYTSVVGLPLAQTLALIERVRTSK